MKLSTYHPTKGIVTIDTEKMKGRLHKRKQTRKKIKGKWYVRDTLLRVAEKLLIHDKKGNLIARHNNWGVAVKRDKGKWVSEHDIVIVGSKLIPANLL